MRRERDWSLHRDIYNSYMIRQNKMKEREVQLPKSDPQYPYIPLQMFLYMPEKREDYYSGEKMDIKRYLFEGTAASQLTPFEKHKFDEFLDYIERKKHKLPMHIINDHFWTAPWKFRWLYSEKYEIKNTIKAMEKHLRYMAAIPNQPSKPVEQFLKQGVFYVSGRDQFYRPLLIFDVQKMLSLQMTIEQLIEAQTFFFEKVLNSMLLPGQVETWVAIIDVGYQNLLSMLSPLKTSFGFLMNTFRCRMRYCYVLRPSSSVSFLWGIAKGFLHEDTLKKIMFVENENMEHLLTFTNSNQLEEKFGGTLKDMTDFWPLKTVDELPNLVYTKDEKQSKVTLIPPEIYRSLYVDGRLKGHHISKILVSYEQSAIPDFSLIEREEQKKGLEELSLDVIKEIPEVEWPTESGLVDLGGFEIPGVPCFESVFLEQQSQE